MFSLSLRRQHSRQGTKLKKQTRYISWNYGKNSCAVLATQCASKQKSIVRANDQRTMCHEYCNLSFSHSIRSACKRNCHQSGWPWTVWTWNGNGTPEGTSFPVRIRIPRFPGKCRDTTGRAATAVRACCPSTLLQIQPHLSTIPFPRIRNTKRKCKFK